MSDPVSRTCTQIQYINRTEYPQPVENDTWCSHLFSYRHSNHFPDCWARAAEPGGKGLPFLWGAFVFGDLWLLYRKQYGLALMYLGAYLLGFLVLALISVIAIPLLFHFNPFLESPNLVTWITILVLSLDLRVPLGLFGYQLYLERATTAIRKLQAIISNPEDLNSALYRKGGGDRGVGAALGGESVVGGGDIRVGCVLRRQCAIVLDNVGGAG